MEQNTSDTPEIDIILEEDQVELDPPMDVDLMERAAEGSSLSPYQKAPLYVEGEIIPEGMIVAKDRFGRSILRKRPVAGIKRKNHVMHDELGNVKKKRSQMRNFFEKRLGIPATTSGRPRKNGFWPTPENPDAAGGMLKYPTPEKLAYAFDRTFQRMCNKNMICTKVAVLLEMKMSPATFKAYRYERGEEYGLICEHVENICEMFLQEEALRGRNMIATSFIKMYHDRQEKQNIEISAKSSVDVMSEDQLRKLAQQVPSSNKFNESDVQNAEIVREELKDKINTENNEK